MMNKLFINNVGDLAEIQRASFYRFLSLGITEELLNLPNPFITQIKLKQQKKVPCLVYIYPSEIKVKGPNFNLNNCFKKDISYSIQIYVAGEYLYVEENNNFKETEVLTNSKSKKIRIKQDILLAEIPLMTEEGTFIINGCERIIISQIIRSPGVYFKKEFNTSNKIIYTATIISDKGLWTKFILDHQDLKKSKDNNTLGKDVIYIKLSDYKSKEKATPTKLLIYDLIRYFGINLEEIIDSLKYPLQFSSNDFISKTENNIQEIAQIIRKLFFNQISGCFSIGEIGRYKINKKLGLNLPKDITYLTVYDFIGIIDGLTELKYYNRINDDIDDIQNKQIRCIGELLQNQLRIGIYRLQKSLIDESLITNSYKAKGNLETNSNFENWIIDPRPITNSIKEFFKTSQLSQFMDQINPLAELTHKRRISVFGPNGLKRDHISTVIRDIHPSQYGRLCPIETPEGQNAGLIGSISMFGRINSLRSIETPYFLIKNTKILTKKNAIFLNPEQESETTIAFSDVFLNKAENIEKIYISSKENHVFSTRHIKQIDFITTSPLQIVSLATALIPFLEHNDANRALMGSNMQRQAVPLLYTQKPIVGTGLETIAILDSEMVIKNYSEGIVELASTNTIIINDKKNQLITYILKKYNKSNQKTSINQRPIVWTGEKVFSGQIIADGPSTNDGELSLGHNLTIAYMPWEGYNYEDAIIINERLIFDDCLTSVHIEEYETNLTYSITGTEKLTNNLPHLTKHLRRHLNNNGIAKVGSYIKENDILVGKLIPSEEDPSPETKLLSVLYNQKNINYRDMSLRVPQGVEGRIVDIRIISNNLLNREESPILDSSQTIRIYIAKVRKIQLGDKLAGRHGNKGIISRILSRHDMPYLPDGTPIDIIFNPLGVPSRMNVGQVFECLLGFAGEKLGKRFKITPFDEIYGNEASRILVNQKLKEVVKNKNLNWFFNSSYPGKIFLKDGRTGEFFDNPILVGKSYILKLIHLVEDKIHARATGPYSMITEQPLAGKSQKGGQRFGEMEVWALEAYGCSNTLQELLTVKSDDIDGRNDIYQAILIRKDIEKPTPSIPESFLTLISELKALGLDFSTRKFENIFTKVTNFEETEEDIFKNLEKRLKIRALLSRKKIEYYGKNLDLTSREKFLSQEKLKEKHTIFEKLRQKI